MASCCTPQWYAGWQEAQSGDSGVPLAGARPRLLGLDLPVAGGRMGLQRAKQLSRRRGDFIDRTVERRGVRLRGPVEAGELAHELLRGGADFLLRCRRVEIEQRLDVAAHGVGSFSSKPSKAGGALAILRPYPSERAEHMPGLLENHIAAVTGAGSGIGRAIALGYAREGARVVVLDVNADAAGETTQQILNAGGKADSFALDVTDREACRAVAAEVGEQGRQRLDPGEQRRHQPPHRLHGRRATPS